MNVDDRAHVIGRIVWPSSADAACRHYLGFAIQVIEPLGLEFPPALPNPIASARRFIAGTLPEADYRQEAIAWWGYIDTVGGVRELQRREALIARVALFLYALPDAAEQLGEFVSWLFLFLGKLGIETSPAEQLRLSYFEYR